MNRRSFRQALAASLLASMGSVFAPAASAQDGGAPSNVMDADHAPAGFVRPKAIGEHDLSMATYARESFVDGEEGIVGLRLLVRKDGTIGDAQVAQTSGFARLDKAATDVVKDWHYAPATLNGAPVDAWMPVDIIWALQMMPFDVGPQQIMNMRNYYPRSGEIGISTARFFAGKDGRIQNVIIEKPSGHQALDDATVRMLKDGWRLAPGGLIDRNELGAWFEAEITWSTRGPNVATEGPCGPNKTADAVVECTEFLMNANLTPYQRSLALERRARTYAARREFDLAIADYSAGVRLFPSYSGLFVERGKVRIAKGEGSLVSLTWMRLLRFSRCGRRCTLLAASNICETETVCERWRILPGWMRWSARKSEPPFTTSAAFGWPNMGNPNWDCPTATNPSVPSQMTETLSIVAATSISN